MASVVISQQIPSGILRRNFSRAGSAVWKRVKAVNDVFEMAFLQEAIAKRSSQGMQSVLFAYRERNFLKEFLGEAYCQGRLMRGLSALKGASQSIPHTPAEKVCLQLSRAVPSMLLYGLGSIALAVHAPQMSIGMLMAATWGSFRWNENLLLVPTLQAYKNKEDLGRLYRENKCHFACFYLLLIVCYALVYYYARNPVNRVFMEKLTQAVRENSLPAIALYYQFHKSFQEETLQRMPDECKTVFLSRLNTLGRSIEKGEQDEIFSAYKEFSSLLREVRLFPSNELPLFYE